MSELEQLEKDIARVFLDARGGTKAIARHVQRLLIEARIEEHGAGCMRCKSEVMMDTGMANCKRIKELKKSLAEIGGGL